MIKSGLAHIGGIVNSDGVILIVAEEIHLSPLTFIALHAIM